MSNAQYTVGNGDRTDDTAFTVPGDEDGGAGDDSFPIDSGDIGNGRQWYVHVENGFDTDVDVTAQGSHYLDESMASAGDDGATETISSGGSIGIFDGETGHSFLQVNINPATTPSSGDLVVTFQSREE